MGRSLAASCSAGMTAPWGPTWAVEVSVTAATAAAAPIAVTTAADCRSRRPPALTGRPSRPTAATAIPAANITRAI